MMETLYETKVRLHRERLDDEIPCDMRRKFVATPVTLNGERARVAGALLPFPKVYQVNGTLEVEFCWETIRDVIALHNGEFKS